LREFLYVDDLASAISFVIENNISEEIINIGSNQEVSIKQLVEILMKVVSFDGEIVFNSDYPDGNPRKLLDSTKITSYGWEPQVDISKGLELTYDWYLKNIDN
jgi:GDP-L-fucose synthase